jgi:ribonucleoside-diphosphate reductase alpha chain
MMAIELYRSSVILAKERGSFIHYNSELELNNPFINRIREADEELYQDMVKYGRRNIGILTIAPTGTISILTQTTSGIEPAFMVAYKRRRKVNPNDPNITVSFVDALGDSWEEYNMFHHKFITWMEINGYNVDEVKEYSDEKLQEVIDKSPYYKSTSNDIDWIAKVSLQGNVQKWVDHSISVTVNLPENTTEKTINDVYIEAFKSGCKGITVYRDGSRSGVLTKKDDKVNIEVGEFVHNSIPKRPKFLECDIHHITAMKQKYIVLVGLNDGKPYEVFAFMKKNIELPTKCNKGKLVKIKSGVYNLEINIGDSDKIVLENLSELFETSDEQIITKLISGCLRHGMHINFIIDILDSVDSTMVSFGKSILRVLVKYENKLLKSKKGGGVCPNCGGTLLKTEGCTKCTSCDYSLCG